MIKVETNSGVVVIINPNHIQKIMNDGDTLWIWMLDHSFSFRLSDSDGDSLISADRWNKLWDDLMEL